MSDNLKQTLAFARANHSAGTFLFNEMKHFLMLGLFISIAASPANGIEIDSSRVTTSGSDVCDQLFIKIGLVKVMLPPRTTYNQRLNNADKTIWAINYHATSNLGGVDLVVGVVDRIFIIPDIWSQIEADAFQQEIVPRLKFDHLYLEIKKVEVDRLYARFSGASARDQRTAEQEFVIIVKRQEDGVRFLLEP